jgi:hypothetical protein
MQISPEMDNFTFSNLLKEQKGLKATKARIHGRSNARI